MDDSNYIGHRGFEWAVSLNRITLNLIGLWPKTTESPRQKLMSNLRVSAVFLGLMFGILIPSIHSLIIIKDDVMLILDNLQFTLSIASCAIRLVIFMSKREAIAPIMDMIAEDWINSKSAQERSAMISRARSARLILICAYCVMGVGLVFLIIPPCFGMTIRLTNNITDPGRLMPLPTHYIYDVTRTPHYELTFIIQSFCIVLAIMCYSGIDNFLSFLVFHVCGQLDILMSRLAHLDRYINSHVVLKKCVEKHNRLLRTIAVIEDTYNITLLVLFFIFALLFAFYGFRVLNLFDGGTHLSLGRLIFFLSTLLNIFIHMCLYCAVGEILLSQFNKLYYAIYDNKWYSMDTNIAKDLLPLLIKSAKPVYLTAGKIFPMTMATFCNLLKTSAGYISFIHTTRIQ